LTIIAEYVGDVDYIKNREDDEGDNNMMTLLYAADPSQSLIICPDKRSNLAHFISGINKGENVPFLLILSA
jgi:[histone H3]-lysine27 N-methyltransferase